VGRDCGDGHRGAGAGIEGRSRLQRAPWPGRNASTPPPGRPSFAPAPPLRPRYLEQLAREASSLPSHGVDRSALEGS
jgi:hypothetical protein